MDIRHLQSALDQAAALELDWPEWQGGNMTLRQWLQQQIHNIANGTQLPEDRTLWNSLVPDAYRIPV